MSDEEVIDLYSLKVPELKAELKSRGLTVSGTKAELISRLEKYMEEHEDVEVIEEEPVVEEVVPAPEKEDKLEEPTPVGNESPPPQNSISMAEEEEELQNTGNTMSLPNVSANKISTMTESERKTARADRFTGTTTTDNSDKKAARANRFGLSAPATKLENSTTSDEDTKRKSRAARFGTGNDALPNGTTKTEQSIKTLKSNGDVDNADALKRRGERFSNALGQVDSKKAKTREERFGTVAEVKKVAAGSMDDRKAARAARFG